VQCVKSSITIEDSIKKSRFIGFLIPCLSEIEALQHLRELHQTHTNASHIVFAYRIKTEKGIVIRFHDAGEPSGTAGKPVYQHLEGKDLMNCLCIVVRYFGGIKLGAGGLTRAYGNSAKAVIEAATLTNYIEYATIKLELAYKQMQNFEYQLKKLDGFIVEQEFSDHINVLIRLPEKNSELLVKQFKPY